MIFHVHITNSSDERVGDDDIEALNMIEAGMIAEDIYDTYYLLNDKYDGAIHKLNINNNLNERVQNER